MSGERAAEELGWTATTPFRDGVRQYVEWHREAAAAVPAVSDRRIAVGALARRAGIAVAWAAATALLVLGVLTLTPVDSNVDSYDTFTTILVMLTPLVLAGGFAWDRTHARGLRAVLWTGSAACLAVAVLPWPHVVDHLGEGHAIVLLLFALVAALAGLVPERRAPLREWIAGVSS